MATNDAILVLPSSGTAIPLPPDVAWIADAWQDLPAHIREAILTLVEAEVQLQAGDTVGKEGAIAEWSVH